MKATFSLEFIGANTYDSLRGFERLSEALGFKLHPADRVCGGPQVAALERNEHGIIRPRWLVGKRDYSQANSKGSRGVRIWYVLEENTLYWVREPRSWKSTVHYHAAVTPTGQVRMLTEEEAREWQSAL